MARWRIDAGKTSSIEDTYLTSLVERADTIVRLALDKLAFEVYSRKANVYGHVYRHVDRHANMHMPTDLCLEMCINMWHSVMGLFVYDLP